MIDKRTSNFKTARMNIKNTNLAFCNCTFKWNLLLTKHIIHTIALLLAFYIKNRALSNIRDEVFSKNSLQLKAVNYSCLTLHLRCLTEFWIRLWLLQEFDGPTAVSFWFRSIYSWSLTDPYLTMNILCYIVGG